MSMLRTSIGRRSFLKASTAVSGGLLLGFNLSAAPQTLAADDNSAPDPWFEFNAFLSINPDGDVQIRVQNPDFGQGLMTSFPIIVAEELDADWSHVQSVMAPYDLNSYSWQFSGGSQSIKRNWGGLRMAGATARHMLRSAAARAWNVPLSEVTTAQSVLHHTSGKSASYGDMASRAATLPVPSEVELKDKSDFAIIGSSRKNLVGVKIVGGQPMFGIDQRHDGMVYAMIVHPPAFGLTLDSFDADSIRGHSGVQDVFAIKTYRDDYILNYFDTNAFTEIVALVGNSTWQLLKAKKALQVNWKPITGGVQKHRGFSPAVLERNIPAARESTADHNATMEKLLAGELKVQRRDGDPELAFANAHKVIERTYHAPYLAHNTLEPMNFFANVQGDSALLIGPNQGPMFVHDTVAERLGIAKDKVKFQMTRMGGGFGRRAYAHFAVEAALISQRIGKPVLLTYSREDDMTMGIYRPTYRVKLRAAIDGDNRLTGYHVKGVGIPESPVFPNRFPAGAVENYLAESAAIASNITTGAFRAPNSNFMAAAEQSFLDEVAEAMGKDAIEMRLELLQRAGANPVGKDNEYDAERYAGVLRLVRDRSGWNTRASGKARGVAAYFCHNSYAAHVIDLQMINGKPVINKVTAAVDCGIVVNRDAAMSMTEGAIVDGIGNALFGEMTFVDGQPQKQNFDSYRMIRMNEAPGEIDVHFVDNQIDPTGLGEPPFPPTFAALANALYRATGKRLYSQPFMG